MAQIWLTYDEMASVFGVTSEDVRSGAIANGWGRMKDRSGTKYVRLSPSLADEYLFRIAKHRQFVSQGAIQIDAQANARCAVPG